MKKRSYTCGLDAAMDVVGGKWKALILWELSVEPLRFGELRRRVGGISEKMLTQQVRELERNGVLRREVYEQVPPKVVYSLTDFGLTLNAALEPLGEWGHRHMETIEAMPRD
ncbi:winged helix-turn-helix transcriptional regulator [Herbidospora cretacea]|uniref:winged helix-turn-helix transcriptional regulator n=1 Tax=Herbidospora cretacea TaxID=28444 RepID=UPI00077477D1|nr:helix-turn-helix domain-containing protein [Herbidospora cretacea]